MVIKMFYSGISASKEVKKRQLRARFLLDSYKIKYEMVDISDPSPDNAEQRDKMLQVAKRRNESNPPFPPQFFNEDDYCGDYEDLESANDNDDLFKFLKLEEDITIENGRSSETGEYDLFVPFDQRKASIESSKINDKMNDKVAEDEVEDEEVEQEVVEQVTINGVVYTIPPNRKIEVGGRIIDVDELLATEGEEVELDEVAQDLKDQILPNKDDDEKEEKENTEEEEEEEEEEE